MKKYEDMRSKALIAYNAFDVIDMTDATTGGQKREIGRQSL